jgi:heme oxygenase
MSEVAEQTTRSKRLKAATSTTHDGLDKTIMSANPFAAREKYALFVKVQHAFHSQIDALYGNTVLAGLLPDMEGRRRLPQIKQDLTDLNTAPEAIAAAPVFADNQPVDIPTALGWLYVAEGSNLGAAFLLKEAEKIGLSAELGARHLAAAPEGRGLHWRTFTGALDTITLSDEEEERVNEGARQAFSYVKNKVDSYMLAK